MAESRTNISHQKTYLVSVWALYFEICCLVIAKNKQEAKDTMLRTYQPRYPRITLDHISVYDIEELVYQDGVVYEISRTD